MKTVNTKRLKRRNVLDAFVARAAKCVPAGSPGDERADAAAVPRVPAAQHAAASLAQRREGGYIITRNFACVQGIYGHIAE